MELVLNLLWLLLVMPAFWVWRRQDRSLGSLRCLLVLACGVVLLFPVATPFCNARVLSIWTLAGPAACERAKLCRGNPVKVVLIRSWEGRARVHIIRRNQADGHRSTAMPSFSAD